MFLPQLVNRAQNRVTLDFPDGVSVGFETDVEFVSLPDAVRNEITDGELGWT